MTSTNEAYAPCAKRQQLTAFKKDGTKAKVNRCTEPTAEHHMSNVDPVHCAECPVRDLVTRAAIRANEFKPPLATTTHQIQSKKKDTNPPKPWLPCADRDVAGVAACCGGVTEIRICDSSDCFRMGSKVTADICSSCPFRKK